MKKQIILLVEDNPDDAELTIRALGSNQIANEIVLVKDGVEALDYMFGTGKFDGRDIKDTPEVVLLDLKLPKVDGLEVLKRIRSNDLTKLTPVVILTSSDEDMDRVNGYRLGANSYIQKPVDFHRFADAVRQLGLYWLLLNIPPPKGGVYK